MKHQTSTESPRAPSRLRPGLSRETDENQCIALSIDIAKQKLLDGTAPTSMVMHFLKLGTTRELLEREMMEQQKELMEAKKQALESQAKVEQMYADAMRAMQKYSPYSVEDDNASPV